MKMFSATERSGKTIGYWSTAAIPRACASSPLPTRPWRPSTKTSPPSGCTTPVMILMSVDLPAPFSPRSAWISPAWSAKETSSSAWVDPNRFETPRISRIGVPGLDAIEPFRVPIEQLFLIRSAEAFHRQDRSIRVDLAEVGAVEDVDRPVGPEHGAIDPEGFDAVKDPRPDARDRPVVVDHTEPGDLASDVRSLRERRDLTAPPLEVLARPLQRETGMAEDDLDARVSLRDIAARDKLAR